MPSVEEGLQFVDNFLKSSANKIQEPPIEDAFKIVDNILNSNPPEPPIEDAFKIVDNVLNNRNTQSVDTDPNITPPPWKRTPENFFAPEQATTWEGIKAAATSVYPKNWAKQTIDLGRLGIKYNPIVPLKPIFDVLESADKHLFGGVTTDIKDKLYSKISEVLTPSDRDIQTVDMSPMAANAAGQAVQMGLDWYTMTKFIRAGKAILNPITRGLVPVAEKKALSTSEYLLQKFPKLAQEVGDLIPKAIHLLPEGMGAMLGFGMYAGTQKAAEIQDSEESLGSKALEVGKAALEGAASAVPFEFGGLPGRYFTRNAGRALQEIAGRSSAAFAGGIWASATGGDIISGMVMNAIMDHKPISRSQWELAMKKYDIPPKKTSQEKRTPENLTDLMWQKYQEVVRAELGNQMRGDTLTSNSGITSLDIKRMGELEEIIKTTDPEDIKHKDAKEELYLLKNKDDAVTTQNETIDPKESIDSRIERLKSEIQQIVSKYDPKVLEKQITHTVKIGQDIPVQMKNYDPLLKSKTAELEKAINEKLEILTDKHRSNITIKKHSSAEQHQLIKAIEEGGDQAAEKMSTEDLVKLKDSFRRFKNSTKVKAISRDIDIALDNRITDRSKIGKENDTRNLDEIAKIVAIEEKLGGYTAKEKPKLFNIVPHVSIANKIRKALGITQKAAKFVDSILNDIGVDTTKIITAKGGSSIGKAELSEGDTPVKKYGEDNTVRTGSYQVLKDGRGLIRFFKGSDLFTGLHEYGHHIRRILFNRDIEAGKRAGISEEDMLATEKEFGVVDGKWTKDQEEAFTKALSKFIAENRKPATLIEEVYMKVSNFLIDMYKRISSDRKYAKEISPEMKKAFDRLLTRRERLERGEGDVAKNAEIDVEGKALLESKKMTREEFLAKANKDANKKTKEIDRLAEEEAKQLNREATLKAQKPIQKTPETKSLTKEQFKELKSKHTALFSGVSDNISRIGKIASQMEIGKIGEKRYKKNKEIKEKFLKELSEVSEKYSDLYDKLKDAKNENDLKDLPTELEKISNEVSFVEEKYIPKKETKNDSQEGSKVSSERQNKEEVKSKEMPKRTTNDESKANGAEKGVRKPVVHDNLAESKLVKTITDLTDSQIKKMTQTDRTALFGLYPEMNNEVEINTASAIVAKNPLKAMNMFLSGEKPANIRTLNSLFVSLHNFAVLTNNSKILKKITNYMAARASQQGQEIEILSQLLPFSPATVIARLSRIRGEAKRTKKIEMLKEIKKQSDKIFGEMTEKMSENIRKFFDSISCGKGT